MGGSHEAAERSGRRGIIGRRCKLELPGARYRTGHPTAENGDGLAGSAAWPADQCSSFCGDVAAVTGGRIKVEVFPSGALVRPFETFDAVSAGVADLYHSFEAYFEQKSPAFHFF